MNEERSIIQEIKLKKEIRGWGWRDGSANNSSGCSSRGPVFESHTHMEQLCNSSSEESRACIWPPKALHVQDVQTYTETKQSDT